MIRRVTPPTYPPNLPPQPTPPHSPPLPVAAEGEVDSQCHFQWAEWVITGASFAIRTFGSGVVVRGRDLGGRVFMGGGVDLRCGLVLFY